MQSSANPWTSIRIDVDRTLNEALHRIAALERTSKRRLVRELVVHNPRVMAMIQEVEAESHE